MALDKETVGSVLSSVSMFKNIRNNEDKIQSVSRLVTQNATRIKKIFDSVGSATSQRNDENIASSLQSGLEGITRAVNEKDRKNDSMFSNISRGVSFVRDTLDQVNEEVWAVKKMAYRNQSTIGAVQNSIENINSAIQRQRYRDIENKRESDFQFTTLQQENIKQRDEINQHKQAIADLVTAVQSAASQDSSSMLGSYLTYQIGKFLLRNPWVIGAGAALLAMGTIGTISNPNQIPESQRPSTIRGREIDKLKADLGIDPTTGGSSPRQHPGRSSSPADMRRRNLGRSQKITGGFGPGGGGGSINPEIERKFGTGNVRSGSINPSSVSSEVPAEGRALLDTISGPGLEGANYNTIVGGGKFDDFSRHPNKVGLVTRHGPSTAAGRYQIIGTTWRNLQKQYPGEFTDFTPATQDKAAWYLARDRYKRETGRDLATDLKSKNKNDIQRIGKVLSGEWTSLPGGIEQGSGAGQFASKYLQNYESIQNNQNAAINKGDHSQDATAVQTERDQAKVIESYGPRRPGRPDESIRNTAQQAATATGMEEITFTSGKGNWISASGRRKGQTSTVHSIGKAVDVTGFKSDEQRKQFIREAYRRGAKGVGVYKDGSIHLDFGRDRQWAWGGGISTKEIADIKEEVRQEIKSGKTFNDTNEKAVNVKELDVGDVLREKKHPLAPKKRSEDPQSYQVSKDLYDAANKYNQTDRLNRELGDAAKKHGGTYDPKNRTISGLNPDQIKAVNEGISKGLNKVPSFMLPENLKGRSNFTSPIPVIKQIPNKGRVENSHDSIPPADSSYRGVHIPGENRKKLKRYSDVAKKGNESNITRTPNDEAHQEVAYYYNEKGIPVI